MGLLDEAIREHLELKRRRGADPNEVAREEHEALAPLELGAELPAWVQGPAPLEAAVVAYGEGVAAAPETATVDQETVEVDMATLSDDGDGSFLEAPQPEGAITARRITSSPEGPQPEDFEWEVPQRHAPGAPHEPAPQQSAAFE